MKDGKIHGAIFLRRRIFRASVVGRERGSNKSFHPAQIGPRKIATCLCTHLSIAREKQSRIEMKGPAFSRRVGRDRGAGGRNAA